jgi:hypothetical protein
MIGSEHSAAAATHLINWVLFSCNFIGVTLTLSVNIAHITEIAELVKVCISIVLSMASTLILYIVNKKKVDEFLKNLFK